MTSTLILKVRSVHDVIQKLQINRGLTTVVISSPLLSFSISPSSGRLGESGIC